MVTSGALDDGTVVVSVEGTVDRHAAGEICDAVLRAVRAGRDAAIIDLSAVDAVRPGVLGILLRLRRRLLVLGGDLRVVGTTDVRSMFGVASAKRLLACVSDRADLRMEDS